MKLVLLLSFVAFGADASKILVWPAEWSHWINMKIIIKELISRDHEVAIMRSSAYTDFIKIDIPEATYIDFYVPYEEGHHLQSMDKVLSQVKLGDPAESSFFGKAYAMVSFVAEQLSMRMNQCELVMSNSTLLNSLNATDFDLVLADPTVMCGELIATKMGVPFVYNVRTLPAELHFSLSQTPMPLSYVPMINTEFSDKMNLFERTLNMITYAYQTIGVRAGLSMMDSIVHKYIDSNRSFLDIVSQSSMWLIRTDFAFEYPRPLMPNVKFIGGFHCQEAEPIKDENLLDWINEAKDGIIVFSMGSMVRSMHKSKAEVIAAALARLPQRVIWRYDGEMPDSLGANTKTMDWIPQNELMGHAKTKLFISHGGTNGLYQAIYHGVPVVGVPLLVDQFDNMLRVTERGAGVTLDITTLTSDELYETVSRVIADYTFTENAQRMSRIHRDKAMTPLESAVFWIEYTIRTKGAFHLRPAAHNLYWYQYLMLDSLALIAAVLYLIYRYLPTTLKFIFSSSLRLKMKTE